MTHPYRGLLAISLAGHIQRLLELTNYRLSWLDELAQKLIRYHDGELYWYAEGLVHDYDDRLENMPVD